MIGQHLLVGYAPGRGGDEALAAAYDLARHTGGLVTVAHVHPPGRPAAATEAATLLERLRTRLDDPATEVVAVASRSVGRGLATAAARAGADAIVIGSAAGGARGRITLGSAADHLLHSAPEAVLVVPAGHVPGARAERLTVMYVGRPQCEEAVLRASVAAQEFGVPLRLLTLALEDDPRGPLQDDLALAVRLALDASGLDPDDVSADLGAGDDVAAAMADAGWGTGEIMVVASSEDASPHRVFLSELGLKMVRAALCPVVVLPRGYT
ncbi:universal stress protein [Actinomadura rayongensis]|uniref:Universal stress protein n=1 Tax=Actinomadura rayongensis TaxID=1429076 RepID=A0A6I4WEL0_9ACTN|nr:universal stress protein [Actinomadura rayongensis]MXQ68248.1 universal stress protein [Actinomadura rayongensis]